jgi:hypothetical protein
MAERKYVSVEQRLVVWEKRNLRCTCLRVSPNHIEMCLTVGSVVVERQVFQDASAASAFALDKMHAYDAN